VARAVNELKSAGALIDTEIKGGQFRRGRGLSVDRGKTLWKPEQDGTAPHTPTDAAEQVLA
jgi:hypothetical protein